MKYRQAIFLYRDGCDDFTVWAVDLPENEIDEILSGSLEHHGTLSGIMDHLPLSMDNTANLMHLLEKDGEGFTLHTKDIPPSFIEKHNHEGCSARGDRESILAEIADLLPAAPVWGQTQHLS